MTELLILALVLYFSLTSLTPKYFCYYFIPLGYCDKVILTVMPNQKNCDFINPFCTFREDLRGNTSSIKARFMPLQYYQTRDVTPALLLRCLLNFILGSHYKTFEPLLSIQSTVRIVIEGCVFSGIYKNTLSRLFHKLMQVQNTRAIITTSQHAISKQKTIYFISRQVKHLINCLINTKSKRNTTNW